MFLPSLSILFLPAFRYSDNKVGGQNSKGLINYGSVSEAFRA